MISKNYFRFFVLSVTFTFLSIHTENMKKQTMACIFINKVPKNISLK